MSGQQGNDRLCGRLATDHHERGAGFDTADGGPAAFGHNRSPGEVISNIPGRQMQADADRGRPRTSAGRA